MKDALNLWNNVIGICSETQRGGARAKDTTGLSMLMQRGRDTIEMRCCSAARRRTFFFGLRQSVRHPLDWISIPNQFLKKNNTSLCILASPDGAGPGAGRQAQPDKGARNAEVLAVFL